MAFQNYSHIDIWKNKLILTNYEGEIYYFDLEGIGNNSKKIFIKNNLQNLSKKPNYGIKDILIFKNDVFISMVKEIRENCLALIIKKAELNLKEIKLL